MIEKITIQNLSFMENKADGTPWLTKNGKKYTRAIITDTGQRNLSIAIWDENMKKNLQDALGTEIELEVSQKGQYWNASVPKKEDRVADFVIKLAKRVVALEQKLAVSANIAPAGDRVVTADTPPPPVVNTNNGVADEEIPF